MADTGGFPTGLSVADARDCIAGICSARLLPVEHVAVELALGRTLAEDVAAPIDVPGFANSAMDGFAGN